MLTARRIWTVGVIHIQYTAGQICEWGHISVQYIIIQLTYVIQIEIQYDEHRNTNTIHVVYVIVGAHFCPVH